MQRRLILEQWNDYLKQVIPQNVPKSQIIGSKRAFYAGAFSVLSSFLKAIDQEGGELDKLDPAHSQVCADIEAERIAFVEECLWDSANHLREALDALP